MIRTAHKTPPRRFYWYHIEALCFLVVVAALASMLGDSLRQPSRERPAATGFRMEFVPASGATEPDHYFGLHDTPFLPEAGEPPETDAERDAWRVGEFPNAAPAPKAAPIRFPVSATESSVSPAPPLFSANALSATRSQPRPETPAAQPVRMTLFYGSDDTLPAVVIEDENVLATNVPAVEARAFAAPAELPGTNTIFQTNL